jgi:GNAT superfamily N-acetyltransferase
MCPPADASVLRDVASPGMLADITIRPATPDDSRRTYDVFLEAADDLARTRGWPAVRRPGEPPERFMAFRASALRHDPDGFWVADVDGSLIGFGIAVQREHVWYLAALHVRPAYQARGVGAEIVRRALAAAAPGSLLTVGADARNPVSNGLYGRFGMFPEVALMELAGPATSGATDILRAGVPDVGDLDAVDRATLDVARPEDHAFWASVSSLHAYTVVRDGRAAGYAYVQADGAIGPIAVFDPVDLAPAVEASVAMAAHLGASSARLRIPGPARDAIGRLLARGWRYGDPVTLVLTSAPWGRWDRYVTSGADALL